MSPDFDPYFTWLGIPPEEQPADYYRLLGLRRFESDSQAITTASERQIQVLRSSPYGDRVELAKKILVELKAARDCLSDPEQKSQYDQQLANPDYDRATSPKLRTRASSRSVAKPVAAVAAPAMVAPEVADPASGHVAGPRKLRRRKSGLLPIFLFCVAVLIATGTYYFVKQSEKNQPSVDQVAVGTEEDSTSSEEGLPLPTEDSPDPMPTEVPEDEKLPLDGGPEVASKVPAPVPPLDDPPTSPVGPVEVAGMQPLPIEAEGLPEAWQAAQRYDWTQGAGKSPYLEFVVRSDAIVYLVVSYAYQGNASGNWQEERLTREKLVELGWQDLGPSVWSPEADSLLFMRACKQGEHHRLRTNKYKPPILVLAGSEASLASPAGTVASTSGGLPDPPVQHVPIPDETQITEAEQLVQEVFGQEMAAAQTPQQQAQLAEQLMQSALESSDEVAARYVLLGHVRDLAIQSGNRSMIIRAVDTLARFHEVDALRMKARAYHAASKLPLDAGRHRDLVGGVLALMEEAMGESRFEIAKPLGQVALANAKFVQSADLDRKVAAGRSEVESRESSYLAVQEARNTLKENPDDPAANLAYGSHLCFFEDDWKQGLPLLAKSGDEMLQTVVTLDLAGAEDASGQAAIGESWFDLAGSRESKVGYLARAHYWYSLALPSLTGLTKAQAEKRLKEIKSLGYSPKGSLPSTTFGAPSPTLPIEKESEAALEGLTKLERRMVGIFEIGTLDKKTNAGDHFSARFFVGGRIAREGTENIGTWALDDGSRIKLTLTPSNQGEVYLRPGRLGTFSGLQTTSDNESRVWQLKPVTAVAAWKVATVDNTHHKNFVLYSNGKVDNPFSQYTWSLKGAGMSINTVHGEATFTIQSDGQTLKGRWFRGGHFVGVRIKDPSTVKDFEVR